MATAVLIAFPGQLATIGHPKAQAMLANPDYGSYEEYYAELEALRDHAAATPDLLTMVVEGRDSAYTYMMKFDPPKNMSRFRYDKGRTCTSAWRSLQDWNSGEEFDWSTLQQLGIDTVLIAGERGIDEYGAGGVAMLTEELEEAGIEVQGIEGCIFPQIPHLSAGSNGELEAMRIKLYEQAVNHRESF